MGLFTKKDTVPDLPPAPTLPDLPRRQNPKPGLPELPQFPQSSRNENLNREIVKSAVSDDAVPEDEEVKVEFPALQVREETPLLPSRNMATMPRVEMPRRSLPQMTRPILEEEREAPRSIEIDEAPSERIMMEKPMTRPIEPIFVRIDKFQASQESFDKILSKVKDIESTLEKIRKVKIQEEEELNKWASEVEQLKHRLSDIDDNIFSQV